MKQLKQFSVIGFAAVTSLLALASPRDQASQTTGAVQMPGDNGKVGIQYRLGAKGEELVFTLEKAEFASRFIMKEDAGFPGEGQRLLVLTYSVQNPGTTDRGFSNQSFAFTVVSPDDENFLCNGVTANGWPAYHPDRRDRLNMQLKPAQKIRALVAIQIHPKGPVNKLIVQRGKGTPVLRYDLKEKVKPLGGTFAGNGGMDILDPGQATLTVPFSLGPWDISVEKVEDVPESIGDWQPDTGAKFAVFTVAVTNATKTPYPLHSSIIQFKLTDEDGGDMPYAWVMSKMSAPEPFNGSVEPGATVRVRLLFKGSLTAKPAKLLLKDAQYSGQSVAVSLKSAP